MLCPSFPRSFVPPAPLRMHGYSDRISHAFAFAAKYYGAVAPAGSGMDYMAHPANVAVILARYGCDRSPSSPASCTTCWRKHRRTSGRCWSARSPTSSGRWRSPWPRTPWSPSSTTGAPSEPGRRGSRSTWPSSAVAEPRALDICVADEIHACGSTVTALRRLGVEYLRTVSRAGSEQTIWWYRSMLEILTARSDWPQREMLGELRLMSADLVRSLRQREEDL